MGMLEVTLLAVGSTAWVATVVFFASRLSIGDKF